MPTIIDSLHRDHASTETLLQILEQEIAVFDRAERPDFDILEGIVDYFRSYQAQCHHPKESLLLARVRTRDPEGAAAMIDTEAARGQAARRLERVAQLINDVLNEQQIARTALDAAVREFVEHERRHVKFEACELLPSALARLHAGDWVDLDARLADTRQPLFSHDMESRFDQLKQRIARWERENQADPARLSHRR